MTYRRAFFSILKLALPFSLLFQFVAASANTSNPGDMRAAQNQTASTVTFTPSIIPVSDPALVNPINGWHQWRNGETVPLPETSPDAYNRYFWRDPDNPGESLETARGVYNFSVIDEDIAAAAAAGKKFAFRVRAMGNDSGGKRYVPDYMSNCGWGYNGTFVPDWNAACFLDNAQNLVNALGARYNNDPRIAWIDLGLYGRWGEWAMNEDIYASAPSGKVLATDQTLIRIVDMQLNAFPNVRKVMMAKTKPAPVVRALSSSDQVGWRVDCLGKDGYFDFSTNSRFAESWSYMQNRWKTAPVIVEFCANDVDPTYVTAINQVRENHIAAIGNGNIDSWSSKNTTAQNNLKLLGKTAGYRFQIKNITVPQTWTPGATIAISTRWENNGVAPHYETTRVLYRLVNANGATVWEGVSSANLRALLPTNGNPVTTGDNLALPANLGSGSYQLRVIVVDPAGCRKPLKLAIGGRQNDGSYVLGAVNVAAAALTATATRIAPTASPTSAPTATPTATRIAPTPTTQPTAVPTTAPTATQQPAIQPITRTFNPTADTFVSSSSQGTNYGGRTTMRTDDSPDEDAFLRFDLSSLRGKTVTQARLRLKVSDAAADNTSQPVRLVGSDTWAERSVTYRTKPWLEATVYTAFNGGAYGAWVEVDVTTLIRQQAGNVFSLGVINSTSDTLSFYSRESTSKPQLIVTYR